MPEEPRILTHHDMEVTLPSSFRPLNPANPIRVYSRNLPHWRQDGATYLVTFRQIDSIHYYTWMEMQREAVDWKERVDRESHRHGGTLPTALELEYEAFQHRHLSKVEGILDEGHGSCLLARPEARKLLTDALMLFQDVRYQVHGFVVMPNHVHLCVTPLATWELEDLLKSWKGFSSRQINGMFKRTGSLWQSEGYDRIVRDAEHFARVMRYMGKNPDKARLSEGAFSLWLGCAKWVSRDGLACHEDESEYGSTNPW